MVRIVRRTVFLLLIFVLAACNLSVPAPTPTLAPTRTASPTLPKTNTPPPTLVAQVIASATATLTATLTPSDTATLTATDTREPSATSSPTATNTVTATLTASATNTNQPSITPTKTATFTLTPSATNTNQPTATATNTPLPTATNTTPPTFTPIPTITPLPIIPTNTATATQVPSNTPLPTATNTNQPTATTTNTVTPSFTPSITPLPSATPTRTLSPDEIAAFNTPVPIIITPTQVVQAVPTLPAPTLDVTPTFITLEAPATDLGVFTPIPFDSTPQIAVQPSQTLQPTVALVVPLPATLGAPPTALPFSGNPPQSLSFALTTSGGINGTSFSLLNDTVLFERNPVDPNEYVTTDSSGILYITGLNGSGLIRLDQSPFSQFAPQSRDENNAFVSAARWSPNGQYVAFIVAGRKLANDGVWVYAPGQAPPQQLLVDCPSAGFPGCGIVSNPFDPNLWESRGLAWSPNSDALLVSVHVDDENRDGLIVLPMGQSYNTRPNVYRYQYGSWALDGSRILVSGNSVDGHEYVGWINRDGSFSELVYDAEANGLWMGFAHQANDGQIYALGAPGNRNGVSAPLQIYNMAGQALTQPIGDVFPDRVEWSPDGTAVFVQSNGRQFIASINGTISEITGQVQGARAINWVNGELPPAAAGASNVPSAPSIPSGVIAGSEYQAGQQLRVLSPELNVRSAPGLDAAVVRNPLTTGDYVVILAGPVDDPSGIRWWQVQTADGVVGWIASLVNGVAMIGG